MGVGLEGQTGRSVLGAVGLPLRPACCAGPRCLACLLLARRPCK